MPILRPYELNWERLVETTYDMTVIRLHEYFTDGLGII